MLTNQNISDFFSDTPLGIALCDISLIKIKFAGMTAKKIRKEVLKSGTFKNLIKFTDANKCALSFLNTSSLPDFEEKLTRAFGIDFIVQFVLFILKKDESRISFDIESEKSEHEKISLKLWISQSSDNENQAVISLMDISEYKITEQQLFRQWLLYYGINRLFKRTISTSSVEEVIDAALEELSDLITSSPVYCVYSNEGKKYSNVAFPRNFPDSDGKAKSCILKNIMFFSKQILAETRSRFVGKSDNSIFTAADCIQNLLIIPIENEGKNIATIGIINRDGGCDFTDQQIFETIASVFKDVILHKISEIKRLEAIDKLNALHKLASVATSTLEIFDFSEKLSATLKSLNVFSHPDKVFLYMFEDGVLFRIDSSSDSSLSKLPEDDFICIESLRSRKVVFSRETSKIDESNGSYRFAAVPLFSHRGEIGCILLEQKECEKIPSSDIIEIYTAASSQIALALSNIHLYEKTRILSLYDPLTGLANRRQMDSILEKSAQEYKTFKKSYSLIMGDIDHFKEYNDTKGHEGGDKLLMDIAGIIKAELRSVDTVTRYGGEEFLVILPDISEKGALNTAERIRSAVQEKTDVTISLGVASSSEVDNIDDLVGMADKALYFVKNNGRNAVKGYADIK
ncbi:MAG: GGDEF domain-containing protein [Spirochaetes bacterium]|nr:GGDEF domain-containing protein [Spirochaetota bacterium]